MVHILIWRHEIVKAGKPGVAYDDCDAYHGRRRKRERKSKQVDDVVVPVISSYCYRKVVSFVVLRDLRLSIL